MLLLSEAVVQRPTHQNGYDDADVAERSPIDAVTVELSDWARFGALLILLVLTASDRPI